jgi:hypothetical protein
MEDRKVALLELEKREEHEVAFQSCLIDLQTLPVFIPTIIYNLNPTDTKKTETIYKITLVYDIYSATTPV